MKAANVFVYPTSQWEFTIAYPFVAFFSDLILFGPEFNKKELYFTMIDRQLLQTYINRSSWTNIGAKGSLM